MRNNNLRFKWSTIFLLIAVFSFSSCTKEVDLWKDQRDNLLGKWVGNADFVKSLDGIEVESGTRKVSIEFLNNERVLFQTNNDFFKRDVNWVYQPDPERISLLDFNSSYLSQLFEVLKNEKDKQVWDTRFIKYESDSPIDSMVVLKRYDVTEKWTLSRE